MTFVRPTCSSEHDDKQTLCQTNCNLQHKWDLVPHENKATVTTVR